jgi:DNA polymerase III delta prime subunit
MSELKAIGTSSIWEKKYEPRTVSDLILPEGIKKFFQGIVDNEDVPNLLFYGSPGRGKTISANAICRDIKADKLYINGSMETSIDTLRYKVQNFAECSSMFGTPKVIVIDEFDMLSPNALKAMKALVTEVIDNCRFILITNFISKFAPDDPLISRFNRQIDFDFSDDFKKELIIEYYKRMSWILTSENVTFDKQILGEFIRDEYPDFRKILGKLQFCFQLNGCIDNKIFTCRNDQETIKLLVEDIKLKKWEKARKTCELLDSTIFYDLIYKELIDQLDNKCKADVCILLAEYQAMRGNDSSLPMVACMSKLMKIAVFI